MCSPARNQRAAAPAPAVWLDGRIVRGAAAVVPIADRGLLYGDGLFETLRVYARQPFRLAAHLARLRRSARTLGMPVPGDDEHWYRAIARVCRANRLVEAAVRLTVTRGSATGLWPTTRTRPRLILQARAIDPALAIARAHGIAVALLPFDRGAGPPYGVAYRHKTLAYLPAVLGRRDALRRGFADGLYLDATGAVTEATTANLFLCRGRHLLTPPAGILPGITRGVVLQLARRLGYAVEERPLRRRHLRGASEVFLTSSIAEIVPVVRIETDVIGNGAPGPVTRRLQAAYAACVARATRRTAIARAGTGRAV